MAYLDYVGLAYFKSLLDETYLRTDYSGDTIIQGNVTFTEPVDADVKNDYLGNQIDKTYIKDIVLDPEGSGALALVLGDGSVSHLLTNTTVSQVRSSANELYPVLLCYDANAEEAQITKTVKYVHDVQINPSTGYISARGMYVKHPTFNRRNSVTQKVEWAYDFTDGVSGLGNPMSQVYAYVDPVAQGGEHCIELRLYGNPNVSPVVPSINDSTNTFSIGVGVTGGNVQFGYCPSTPLYLDNGSTLRTEATGHGNDIITRDWLNLNGSLTGLVHTTMNETIDGAKTFKKTVTINSGDNNNKADLYVQGNSDVHGNEHVYGTETVDGKLTANGTAEIKGGSGSTPSLTVTGDERVTGNSSVDGNSSVAGNETVSGKITGNNGAEINGGNGLVVNGNETVNGEIYKLINNTPQEYVSYVTNKQETKTTIVNNLIKDKGGLAADANKNIYVDTGKGLAIDSTGKINVDFSQMPTQDVANIVSGMVAPGSGLVADSSTGKLAVDFNQMPTAKFEALLASLKMLVPLTGHMYLQVNKDHANASDTLDENRGTANKPFKTVMAAVNYVTSKYTLGNYNVYITIFNSTESYKERFLLPSFSTGTGSIILTANDYDNPPVLQNLNNAVAVVQVLGGNWYFIRLDFTGVYNTPADLNIPNYFYGLVVNNGTVNIEGCSISVAYNGVSNTKRIEIRTISLGANAICSFVPLQNYATSLECYRNNATAGIILYISNAVAQTYYSNIDNTNPATYSVYLAGNPTIVVYCSSGGKLSRTSAGNYLMDFYVYPNKTLTGQKYYCLTGGGILATTNGIPGTEEGIVDSSTAAWYKEQ